MIKFSFKIKLLLLLTSCHLCMCQKADEALQELQLTRSVRLSNGVEIIGVNGSAYQSFVGIPFAEPPVDKLRFAASD